MFPTSRFCWPLPLRQHKEEQQPKPLPPVAIPAEAIVELNDEPDELPVDAVGQIIITFYSKSQAANLHWHLAEHHEHFDGSKTTHELSKLARIAGGVC